MSDHLDLLRTDVTDRDCYVLSCLSEHAGDGREVSWHVTSKVILTPRNFNFPSKDKFGNDLVGYPSVLGQQFCNLGLLTVFRHEPWPIPGGLDNLISKDFYLVPTWLYPLLTRPDPNHSAVGSWRWDCGPVSEYAIIWGPQLKANIVHEQWDSHFGWGLVALISAGPRRVDWPRSYTHRESQIWFSSLSPCEVICSCFGESDVLLC